jgi:TRAP-type mannitol/chloroaromatic compound transport system permease small subunit
MNALTIAIVASEAAALVAIVHLWLRRKMRWWAKLLWSVFLFVPFLGLVFYGFVTISPDPHDDDPEVGPYSAG